MFVTALCYIIAYFGLFLTPKCCLEWTDSAGWVFSAQPTAQVISTGNNFINFFVPICIFGFYIAIVIIMRIVSLFVELQ